MANTTATTPEVALSESVLTESPVELFRTWFDLAQSHSGFFDPNAMCLSTLGADGYPDSRMVLLKSFDQHGFVFFTNSLSRKGRALAVNPKAALNFFWDPLRIQIRVQGDIEVVSDEESNGYFRSRSRRSQLGALVSKQSEILSSREDLENAVAQKDLELSGKEVPRPEHWHGYRVIPTRVEFWKDRDNRLHDRFAYERTEGKWKVARLYP